MKVLSQRHDIGIKGVYSHHQQSRFADRYYRLLCCDVRLLSHI
ncbi:hypothetical protein NIES2104_09970 [Leptolyngbya sp. NIES-2104]|nr:hypothetical protein NIES2104_09970 [Leptolyngbya sp. NIES-2104]